jgi:hypothetical protein
MLVLILELARHFRMECLDQDVNADVDAMAGTVGDQHDLNADFGGKAEEEVDHPFGNLDCISLLINKPDRPVRIRFSRID